VYSFVPPQVVLFLWFAEEVENREAGGEGFWGATRLPIFGGPAPCG